MDLRESTPSSALRHPWETSRLRFFRQVLLSQGALKPGTTLVDIGSGDGFFARYLRADVAPGGRILAVDSNYTDEHLRALARDQDTSGVEFTRTWPSAPVDLVLLMDVLEHVPDDEKMLRDTVSNLVKPGGHVLISVPAWNQLYTRHDAILGHYRRYSGATLRALVGRGGLTLKRGGGLFHTLLPVRALQRLAAGKFVDETNTRRGERPAVHADTGLSSWRAGDIVTGVVDGILRIDNGLSASASRLGIWLPGLSVWALARRGG